MIKRLYREVPVTRESPGGAGEEVPATFDIPLPFPLQKRMVLNSMRVFKHTAPGRLRLPYFSQSGSKPSSRYLSVYGSLVPQDRRIDSSCILILQEDGYAISGVRSNL